MASYADIRQDSSTFSRLLLTGESLCFYIYVCCFGTKKKSPKIGSRGKKGPDLVSTAVVSFYRLYAGLFAIGCEGGFVPIEG